MTIVDSSRPSYPASVYIEKHRLQTVLLSVSTHSYSVEQTKIQKSTADIHASSQGVSPHNDFTHFRLPARTLLYQACPDRVVLHRIDLFVSGGNPELTLANPGSLHSFKPLSTGMSGSYRLLSSALD